MPQFNRILRANKCNVGTRTLDGAEHDEMAPRMGYLEWRNEPDSPFGYVYNHTPYFPTVDAVMTR
eukprot:6028495-Prorocentrum_lima.AAC.1